MAAEVGWGTPWGRGPCSKLSPYGLVTLQRTPGHTQMCLMSVGAGCGRRVPRAALKGNDLKIGSEA